MERIGKAWRDDAVVDTCDKGSIVTTANRIRDIDLQTLKTEEIPFEAEFNIKMKSDDYVNVSRISSHSPLLTSNYMYCVFKGSS